jgi:allene oxide cyclase
LTRRIATRRRIAALATASVMTAAVAAAGGAPAYAHPAHAASSTVVHVVEHAITDTEVPGVGGKDVKGNILTFNNPVFNTADKKQIGHDEGFCTRLQVKLGIWECLWTTFLKGGQLTVQGPFYDTHNSIMSITGGTGRYEGARGQMNLNSRNGGKEYDFIFHLL